MMPMNFFMEVSDLPDPQNATPGHARPRGLLTMLFAAFSQQRIRHGYRPQRATPRPSRTAKSGHQSQFGVDGLDVTHARSLRLPSSEPPRANGMGAAAASGCRTR
jgi:hypothetical protein